MSDETIHRRSKKSPAYWVPYRPGNLQNLDSLGYQYEVAPTARRWGNFGTFILASRPIFDRTFRRLSDSGRSERWLAMAGSEVSYVPVGVNHIVRRELQSGSVCIVESDFDNGTFTLLLPLPDVRYQTAGDLE